jgi:hypothetical protein
LCRRCSPQHACCWSPPSCAAMSAGGADAAALHVAAASCALLSASHCSIARRSARLGLTCSGASARLVSGSRLEGGWGGGHWGSGQGHSGGNPAQLAHVPSWRAVPHHHHPVAHRCVASQPMIAARS